MIVIARGVLSTTELAALGELLSTARFSDGKVSTSGQATLPPPTSNGYGFKKPFLDLLKFERP